MDVLMWVVRVSAIIAIALLSRHIGFEDGRRKGFMMTVWALEKGHIGITELPDGSKVITMSEEVESSIKECYRQGK